MGLLAGLSVGLTSLPGDADAKRKRARGSEKSRVSKPAHPLLVVVSLDRQRLAVYDGLRRIRTSRVSSGKAGYRTPKGIFSILQKRREHYSNLYNDAPMPFMQRLTWSGIALHQGRVPNYPASHGCIRLPGSFARSLFSMTSRGTRVIVTDDPVTPRAFSHPLMLKPLPPSGSLIKTASLQPTAIHGAPGDILSARPEVDGAGNEKGRVDIASIQDRESGSGVETRSDTAGSPRWLSREELKAQRDAMFAKLEAALRDTRDVLDDARQEVAARRRALRLAGKAALQVKKQIRRLQREEARAVRLAKRAAAALASFERRYRKKEFDPIVDAQRIARAQAQEDQLETRYFELAEDAYLARRDTAEMRAQLPSYQQNIDAARSALNDALRTAKGARLEHVRARQALKGARMREKLRKKPIAIFISRKKGRLYIRQGYKPIYETAVTIADPDKPIGTHVFTALRFTDDKTDLAWSVVSFDAAVRGPRHSGKRKRRRRRNISYRQIHPDEALERITIPDEARYQIAQLIKPGSSLIISDKRASNETGEYTDFIVSLN